MEYAPAPQLLQTRFEVLVPLVEMYWPVVQSTQGVQDATFEAVEYFPDVHAVQVVAPVLAPVSVIDLVGHELQMLPAKLFALWY